MSAIVYDQKSVLVLVLFDEPQGFEVEFPVGVLTWNEKLLSGEAIQVTEDLVQLVEFPFHLKFVFLPSNQQHLDLLISRIRRVGKRPLRGLVHVSNLLFLKMKQLLPIGDLQQSVRGGPCDGATLLYRASWEREDRRWK